MNNNKKTNWLKLLLGVIVIVGFIGLVICTIIGFIYRFKHPEMTETQLFLWYIKNYWRWYAIFIGGYIGLKIVS